MGGIEEERHMDRQKEEDTNRRDKWIDRKKKIQTGQKNGYTMYKKIQTGDREKEKIYKRERNMDRRFIDRKKKKQTEYTEG
jgi:hypothetical protein